jgi:hypothetical protein
MYIILGDGITGQVIFWKYSEAIAYLAAEYGIRTSDVTMSVQFEDKYVAVYKFINLLEHNVYILDLEKP